MDKIKEILRNYRASAVYICIILIAGLAVFTKWNVFTEYGNQEDIIAETSVDEKPVTSKIAGPSSLEKVAETVPETEKAIDTNISSAYDSVNFEKLIMQLGRYTEPDPAEKEKEERARREKELASKSELEKKQRDQISLSGAVMA